MKKSHFLRPWSILLVLFSTLVFVPHRAVAGTGNLAWDVQISEHPEWATSVTFGNGRFVAVGDHANKTGAAVFYSDDGETWQGSTLYGSGSWLEKVIFADERFVAVGRDNVAGKPLVLYSDDGITWAEGSFSAGPGSFLVSVAYAGGVYLAVGDHLMLRSENAVSWERVSIDAGQFYGVAHGQGKFLVVGQSGVHVSLDGSTWTQKSYAGIPLPDFLPLHTGRDLFYFNNRFWACGGHLGLSYSPDGGVWTPAGVPWVSSLIELDETVFAVGLNLDHLGSLDGGDWASETTGHSPFRSVAAGNGKIVAVGNGQFGVRSAALKPRIAVLPSVAGPTVVGGSLALQVYAVGEGPLEYQWMRNGAPIVGATDATYEIEGLTLSHSGSYTIKVSNPAGEAVERPGQDSLSINVLAEPPLDPAPWSTVQLDDSPAWATSLAYGKGRFVAVGDHSNKNDAVIYHSRDGKLWKGGAIYNGGSWLEKVIFAGDRFVAVGRNGFESRSLILSSDDGIVWTKGLIQGGGGSSLASVAYADGVYVAVGQGVALRSEDAVMWEQVSIGGGGWFYGVTHGLGEFLAAGNAGTFVSTNGYDWSLHSSATPLPDSFPNYLGRDLVFFDGRFWAAGAHFGLTQSLDGMVWTPAGSVSAGSSLVKVDDASFLK